MKRHARWWVLALLIASAAAVPLISADSTVPDRPQVLRAVTIPSMDITVSFVRPGRIVKLFVSEGQQVKEGQLIAQQDDREEQAALKRDKKTAEDDTEIEAEKTIHEKKVRDVENMSKYGSEAEYREAEVDEKVEAAKIKIAQYRREDAALKAEETAIVVDKLQLVAPISGTIAQEFLKAGESAEGGNSKAVRIVQLDPLWAEVPVSFLQARKLKTGDPARVTFSVDGAERPASVIWVREVGDAASQTVLVRISIPNSQSDPAKRFAGESVSVSFPSINIAGARP